MPAHTRSRTSDAEHLGRRPPRRASRRAAAAAVAGAPLALLGAIPAVAHASGPSGRAPAALVSALRRGVPGGAPVAPPARDGAHALPAAVVHPSAQLGPGLAAFGSAVRLPGPLPRGHLAAVASAPGTAGYWVLNAAGRVFAHGSAATFGSVASRRLAGTHATSLAAAPGGSGYWVAAADGRLFPFGQARFYGSAAGLHLHSPVVGVAATPDGHGYWLATAAGGVFPFGDARFLGSPNSAGAGHAPVVGIAAVGHGRQGYWLATAAGGVYHYGSAAFHGTLPRRHIHARVTGIAAPPSGSGYWLATAGGSVFAFGQAAFRGAASPEPSTARVVGMTAMGPAGYLEVATYVPPPVVHRVVAQVATTGTPLGAFVVTCYDLPGTTASGATVSLRTVAVDPSVIPMGATIEISGVGIRVAQDTGGAIVGHRLDIWEPTYQQCMNWGVRTESVQLLKP